MKATQQLRDEHEGVKVMLNILERVGRRSEGAGNLNGEHFEGILEFLKVFVDRCHHGKEEELLFPALIAAGLPQEGLLEVLLREHKKGRSHVEAMGASYAAYRAGDQQVSAKRFRENVLAYIALLRGHIEKENNVLFATADLLLPGTKQDELFEGFARIEEERIGSGKHEAFHALLEKLSGIYLYPTP